MSEGAAAYPTGQTSRMRELRHTRTHTMRARHFCVYDWNIHPAHHPAQRDIAPASPAQPPDRFLTSDSGGRSREGKRNERVLGSIDRPNAAASQWPVCLSGRLTVGPSFSCLVTLVFISFSALERGPASRSPLDPAPSFLRYLAVITSLSPPRLPSSLSPPRPVC